MTKEFIWCAIDMVHNKHIEYHSKLNGTAEYKDYNKLFREYTCTSFSRVSMQSYTGLHTYWNTLKMHAWIEDTMFRLINITIKLTTVVRNN